MKDSHRTRKRIIAYLVSQGGRVTSGQDGLTRHMFERIARAEYDHVLEAHLKNALLAMEDAGLIAIKWTFEGSRRMCAVSLSVAADVTAIEEEDFDLFHHSIEEVWTLVKLLQARNTKLNTELHDSLVVLDELAAEEQVGAYITSAASSGDEQVQQIIATASSLSDADALQLQIAFNAILEQQRSDHRVEIQNHEAGTERLVREQAARIARIDQEYRTAIERLNDAHTKVLASIHDKHAAYRVKVNQRKSHLGNQLADLKHPQRKQRVS